MQKSRIGLSFQNHLTLLKHSTDDSNKQAGKASTCTHISYGKYLMEWTFRTQGTCPQATTTGSEAQRFVGLKKCPAHTEQTPIDEARDSVTLLLLL